MKKGQIFSGIVQKVSFPNKGIVTIEEGKTVVVKNTLPGQQISFSIQKVRKGKAEGRLLEIQKPSDLELKESYCEHFGECGGCTYQNIDYKNQLNLKEEQIKEILSDVVSQTADFEQIFEGVKESPKQFAYRNKMEYTFGDSFKGGPLSLGMHKRGSFYDIVRVKGCKIVEEDFNMILEATCNFFDEKQIPFFHRLSHEGYLRHLLVRKGEKTGEILIDLITTTQLETLFTGEDKESLNPKDSSKESSINMENDMLKEWKDVLLSLPLTGQIVGILHTKNDSVADIVKNEGTDLLFGQEYFYEELLGLKFKISPFSFFQTNSLGAEVLYETARTFIQESGADTIEGKVIYDLYSGTGTIAQMLAPVAEKVIGVEIVPEAVEAAKENATRNQLYNCEFLAGDVLKVLDQISDKPDFIVLDPPRDGIHPKAIEKIISYGVEKMVYISCKPTSLARDLEIFQARGYEVKRICCVDMFPGTVHVEVIILLQKA